MKIDLSREEYRSLLDILHIAEVIISGHRRQEDPRTAPHRKLLQSLYARAGEAGFGDLFVYHAAEQKHHPTEQFEDNALSHTLIDEFVDHAFWDQLISRLTARDAAQEAGGREQLMAMSENDREILERPINERYIREFSQNGIESLAVVDRFVTGQETAVRTSD
jgi:hypothetical protein